MICFVMEACKGWAAELQTTLNFSAWDAGSVLCKEIGVLYISCTYFKSTL
jgi:hypothetical protein